MFPLYGMQTNVNPNHNKKQTPKKYHLSISWTFIKYLLNAYNSICPYGCICLRDRQVKQYTVYEKYDTCYDWDMLHRVCETRRETLRSGIPSELTQMW